jgi:hypothetical protein
MHLLYHKSRHYGDSIGLDKRDFSGALWAAGVGQRSSCNQVERSRFLKPALKNFQLKTAKVLPI